ncbi:MAG TPA: histidine phosphatase family protein [Bacteroidales bacterium]|nr:histidine phosphatase family protein [Bacteroidales bacterium]
MTRFVLIRHALTDHVGKYLSGRTPGIPLNSEGKKQASELAKRLSGAGLTALYCSPLERAVETADRISTETRIPLNVSHEFIEVDFGNWTGAVIEDLRKDPLFTRFNTFRSCTRIPGGELISEAQTRIVRGIEKLKEKHPGGTVAIVSHADLIKAAVAFYAGIHIDLMNRIEISPASVTIMNSYDESLKIILLNSVTGAI